MDDLDYYRGFDHASTMFFKDHVNLDDIDLTGGGKYADGILDFKATVRTLGL